MAGRGCICYLWNDRHCESLVAGEDVNTVFEALIIWMIALR